eukprot:CAMPEP_0177335840 /NCGR_PEP_ID=MMETSP0368-20130122/23470_1 /TAXON_ID=447022 ORGANISM="Scrippsiella hangoei-like, Strain SHHI-4" /NCGR_SAMPLE_ID=MMETSP0368 /ASSEMBLY_ACC=CAM_ASM_000363 /LENGTH=112 /DNA_ID=CAMNT_0018796659 /DNA_START=20 /DNA_END=358 /DNA_ORIENTATION=-
MRCAPCPGLSLPHTSSSDIMLASQAPGAAATSKPAAASSAWCRTWVEWISSLICCATATFSDLLPFFGNFFLSFFNLATFAFISLNSAACRAFNFSGTSAAAAPEAFAAPVR